LASNRMRTQAKVTMQFWTKRYLQNFLRPLTRSVKSPSVTIRAGTIKPAMQPMGMARVPRAVDKARSWSPNHTVASLLELLPNNTYANAPRTFLRVAPTLKFSAVGSQG
jgi:hypothetical protein